VECSDQLPVWNLSLARIWFTPSVQLAASAVPPVPWPSKPGFNTRLLPDVGVFVCVAVGVKVGEDKAVEVGVDVCDAVAICVAVDVAVTVGSDWVWMTNCGGLIPSFDE
jgi:hypothetical protein